MQPGCPPALRDNFSSRRIIRPPKLISFFKKKKEAGKADGLQKTDDVLSQAFWHC
jgi:hypothetical protein